MAGQILTDCKVYLSKYSIGGDLNQVDLDSQQDIHDGTQFGATAKRNIPGLDKASFTLNGFSEFGANKIEEILRTNRGLSDLPMSVIPSNGLLAPNTENNIAFFFKGTLKGYQMGAAVGEAHSFQANGMTSSLELITGFLAATEAARTTTGTGAGKALSAAIGASQYLYAILHVLTVTGTTPTLDVIVESDDTGGFSTPITRLTIPQITAAGSVFATRVAGPIATDTFYRMKWTIGGTTPSFTFAGLIGAQ